MADTVTGPLGAEGRYFDALRAGHVELPQCKGCGKWHWPAVWRCGQCGSWEHDWHKVDMKGTIFSWTRTHHNFGGTEGFEKPFVSIIVALDQVPVRLLGIMEGDTSQVKIGLPVVGRTDKTVFNNAEMPAIRWKAA